MSRRGADPIIVCPLAFERALLLRYGVAVVLSAGPGERGVERVGEMIGVAVNGPVLLAGVAGAVDRSCAAGEAYVISEVIGEADEWLKPTWQGPNNCAGASVSCSGDVLTTAEAKRAFAARTGAQLVDQESVHFARLASARGWEWGIVRGVSDDLSTTLPPDIHQWVTTEGRTRPWRALLSCLRRPNQISTLIAIQRNSAHALKRVASILNDAM